MTLLSRIALFGCIALLDVLPAMAQEESEYKLLVIGDLHFDGAAYHKTAPRRKHQIEERKRNLAMWQGVSQTLLKDAAKHLGKEVPFVIQVGDITQGDCDTVELHEQMFRDAYTTVKGLLNGYRYLGVKGNHDIRLVNGENPAAAANAYLPLLAKEAGIPKLESGNYALMHGPDLFLFVDSHATPKGSVLSFVKKELAAHPDTRYVFFVTHLPLFPSEASSPDWLAVDHVAVRDLLLSRRAVVLAGHTHVFSHIVYRDGKGRTLPQLITTSIGSRWHPEREFKKTVSGFDQFCEAVKKYRKAPGFPKDFPADSLPEFTIFSGSSGHAVLEVNDGGVTARICTGKPQESFVIPLLSK